MSRIKIERNLLNPLLNRQKRGKLVWKGDKNSQFTAKAYFKFLEGVSPIKALGRILWNPYVPSKVCFFAREAWWRKVLTTQQLKKRGYHVASRCSFCRRDEDGLEHILVHCPLIWGLWADLLSVVGACWTCPFLVKDLICSWVQFPVRKNVGRLWWAALLAFCGSFGKKGTKLFSKISLSLIID